MLFAARLPGRPSDLLCLEAERREEKSTHKTKGEKKAALYGAVLSVGDLNACMSEFGLRWKDTYDVCITELFLFSNRLGYKRFARKKESFHEKCFCACVCDRPPSVGEDYYLIIRQACSI